MYTSENPIDWSETKCSIWDLKLFASIKEDHDKTQNMSTWYYITVQKKYLFLRNTYSKDRLKKSEDTGSLEKFYDSFNHFLEVVVSLNKCCSRSKNIDDLDINSLRYFLMKI